MADVVESEARAGAAPRNETFADRTGFLAPLFVISIFIPEAFGFFLFDLRLTPVRALLLVSVPFILFMLVGNVAARRYRFQVADLVFLVTMVWMVCADAQIDGLDAALKTGGVSALEFGGAYFLMRATVHTGPQARKLLRLFCGAAIVAGLLATLDVFAGQHVLREGLARITGYQFAQRATDLPEDYRLGILRVAGPFEHPILAGIMMCYALLLSEVLDGWRRYLCWFACGLCLFLSLSSAPWEGLIVGLALTAYSRFVRVPARWTLLVGFLAVALTIFFLSMPNPLGWIFNHFTLDAGTGYFRMMIWQAAGADVLDSPILGIGSTIDWFRPTWMPPSVDALWLREAMLFGIPGSIMVALCLITSCFTPVRATLRNALSIGSRDVAIATKLEIITLLTIYLGFTVFYWGSVWVTIGMLAGLRASLGAAASD